MKKMVFDVPAESGGALSVLSDVYSECKKDTENEYIFVISIPHLEEAKNITIQRFPWIKRSWFHRLYFDYFIAPKLIEKYNVDEVLSLQNTIIPKTNTFQTVYVHNALPFNDYKFSFFENKLLWTYQNLISRSIVRSVKKANKVIVQTNWMKKIFVEKLKINPEKINVEPPKIDIEVKKKFVDSNDDCKTFFYPASGVSFKNHKAVVKASKILKNKGIIQYKILFTLQGNENKEVINMKSEIEKNKLPIFFIGNLSREEVFENYSKYILIFPSFIESSPLPLTEAKMHNTPILASNCNFSWEILEDYNRVSYFDPFDADSLALVLMSFL